MRNREQCPRCGFTRIWNIRRQRHRCARCRYDWRLGPPLRLSRQQWEALLRGHVKGLTNQAVAQETGLHRQRVLRALTLVRTQMLRAVPVVLKDILNMETTFNGDSVFGVLCRGGQVWAQVVTEEKLNEMLPMIYQRMKKGSIVCSDLSKTNGKDVGSGSVSHLLPLENGDSSDGDNPINGLKGFWSYLKKHRSQMRGSHRERLPLYLAEHVWRYNHRFLSMDQRVHRLMKLLNRNGG
ncbi:MAG: transposase [Elusimicrobia bacterium]|nr:transposase [Elusimicrobiota bacterium]